jgi:hypothetical protein
VQTFDRAAAKAAGVDGLLLRVGRIDGVDDVSENGRNGARVQLFDCGGSGYQQWQVGPNNSLLNPLSGRCLDLPEANPANGTRLQVSDCIGSSAQQWTLP